MSHLGKEAVGDACFQETEDMAICPVAGIPYFSTVPGHDLLCLLFPAKSFLKIKKIMKGGRKRIHSSTLLVSGHTAWYKEASVQVCF